MRKLYFQQLLNIILRYVFCLFRFISNIIKNPKKNLTSLLIKSTGKCTGIAFTGTACNLWGSGFLLFLLLASFLRNLPRKGLEGVAERAIRGRLRADAVYDAAVGNSISRSLKRYGLILHFRLIIAGFVVQGCGIDNIKRFLVSLGLPLCIVSPDTHSLRLGQPSAEFSQIHNHAPCRIV